ncbi:MAG: zinc metallopeptidase [Clostridia bacterium]|nr:zinc metallopeptidase [Clostridia bacterium]MDD4387178.1 zinc metallopeptidase [Clostridia bacterium]
MINYFEKWNKKKIQLSYISNKFCSNDIVCKQMLELISNKSTNIKLDTDIKNNYYVFLTDTIYLSNKEITRNSYQRICVIAHECIHSIQNKIIQVVNFALSNVELIAFVISLICITCGFNTYIVFYSYLILNIFSAIPRLILEIDATIRSINLSSKYMKYKIDENELSIILKTYKLQILLLLPFFIISLLIGRGFRLSVVYIFMLNNM